MLMFIDAVGGSGFDSRDVGQAKSDGEFVIGVEGQSGVVSVGWSFLAIVKGAGSFIEKTPCPFEFLSGVVGLSSSDGDIGFATIFS